jgi:hypothetical protein
LTGGWLTSDENWPDHSHPEWRKTLTLARRNKWFLKPMDHRYGHLVCRLTPDSDYCGRKIDSTATGTESIALEMRRVIKACPHKDDDAGWSSLDQAVQLLDSADRLLDAAEKCLTGLMTQANALDLVDLALAHTDNAEAYESAFLEAVLIEEQGRRELAVGVAEAESENIDLGEPPDPSVAIGQAGVRGTQAHALVRGKPGAAAKALLARISDLRLRAAGLRRLAASV